MSTESEVKTAETLKAYSDACDDTPEYKFVCAAFNQYAPFTHAGLNQVPHIFRPAIALMLKEYADLQYDIIKRAELIDSNSFEERCSEASHYTWLDDQNNALVEENTRLREENAELLFQFNGIDAEYDKLQAENIRLREALRKLLKYMDDGFLVRDISKDHEPGWAIKMLPFVADIKAANELLNPK